MLLTLLNIDCLEAVAGKMAYIEVGSALDKRYIVCFNC